MTYKDFVQEYTYALQKAAGPDAVIEQQAVQKANITKTALIIKQPDTCIAPTIYPEEEFKRHLAGMSIAELAAEAVSIAKQASIYEIDPKQLSDPSYILSHAYCAVVGKEANAALLTKCPHEDLADLAVIARCSVGAEGSFIITKEACQAAMLTPEEVMDAAHRGTERQSFRLENMASVMARMTGDPALAEDAQASPLYVLTNSSGIDGAAGIIKSGMLQEASRRIAEERGYGESIKLFILPSSRHEVLLLPEGHAPELEEMKTMVREINRSIVSPEDRLSDSVYYFDGRHITLADSAILGKTDATAITI